MALVFGIVAVICFFTALLADKVMLAGISFGLGFIAIIFQALENSTTY